MLLRDVICCGGGVLSLIGKGPVPSLGMLKLVNDDAAFLKIVPGDCCNDAGGDTGRRGLTGEGGCAILLAPMPTVMLEL